MQIPSHTSVGTSEFEGRTHRILRIVTRLYVPIVTLIIIALIGSWAAPWANFDPLTVAQNGRLKFQSGDEVLAAKETNRLSPAEARLATDVVREGLNRYRGWSAHPVHGRFSDDGYHGPPARRLNHAPMGASHSRA